MRLSSVTIDTFKKLHFKRSQDYIDFILISWGDYFDCAGKKLNLAVVFQE